MDDLEMKKDIQNGIKDPLVDITQFEDKSLDEGYGTQAEKVNGTGTISQAMIKRFNQHSIMVTTILLFVFINLIALHYSGIESYKK